MNLIDTHCHIQSAGLAVGERTTRELWAKESNLTPENIIANAQATGVTKMVCVGCDLRDSQLAVEFVQARGNCWASIGIHPHEAKLYADKPDQLSVFAELAVQPKVVAIGECGFDFFYGHSPKEAQETVLRFQLELALKHNLPVIFHVREAFEAFWPLFDDYRGVRGVLHSFTDSLQNMQRAVSHGLLIGVNGIATFAKNPKQLEMYRAIPPEHLVLETDAPFLTPHPYRGTINQPKYVRQITEFLADLRGEHLDKLAAQTTANAESLFGI